MKVMIAVIAIVVAVGIGIWYSHSNCSGGYDSASGQLCSCTFWGCHDIGGQ